VRWRSSWIGHSVSVPWRSWDELTSVEQRLYVAVQEQAGLWETPLHEVDRELDGDVHRPVLDPAECSETLASCLRDGLIELYRTEGTENRDLTADEAGRTVVDWSSWGPAADGLFLYPRDDA